MFEDKIQKLLKKALDIEFTSDITTDFYREFFELVSDVIINMEEGEDSFFGSFMLKVEREIRLDITWPLATIPKINGFVMYFNPILFLQNTKKEMIALFKHEIYHMMYSHYERVLALKDKFSKEAIGIAMDISINQFIKNMPSNAQKIDTVNKELDINLKWNRTIEEYAFLIEEALRKRVEKSKKDITIGSIVREVDIREAHEVWDEVDISDKTIDSNLKKIALNLKAKAAPEDIQKLIKAFSEREELAWNDILKRMLPSVKSGYKKTITRRNRRQPDRLDLKGTLPKNVPEIIIAIDISASMTDEDVKKIMIEVLAITNNRRAKITVIECDNEIRRIYPLRSAKDIKKRSSNNGSTAFSPVFEYVRENNLRDNILIYFTDGVGERELSCNIISKEVLWVIIGDEELSLKKYKGTIRRLKINKKVGEGKDTGLSLLKEVIHDWAR